MFSTEETGVILIIVLAFSIIKYLFSEDLKNEREDN